MTWSQLSALSLFVVVFAVALVVKAPPEFARRIFGVATPPMLALIVPHPAIAAGGIPELGIAPGDVRMTWRYERFSFRRFGPVYRVGLAGRGFAGKGLAVLMLLPRRVLLEDVRLTVILPHLHETLRRAAFRPLGRVSVALDRFEADAQPWTIGALAGRARWEGARSELAPEIAFGVIDAQLSSPGTDRIRAGITNHGGDLALSGELTLDAGGSVDVDLLVVPRSGSAKTWAHALEALATREGAGWRLRRTLSLASM